MTLVDRIAAAEQRIRGQVRETPLMLCPSLSAETGGRVFLKLENLQLTGSFKVRGALNKMLSLSAADRARGVVTASSGNHGAAVAYAGGLAGVVPTVYLPQNAVPSKVAKIRKLGARVQFFGDDSGLAEVEARRVSERTGQVYLSPYNDWDVVAGQGTIGAELLRQCPSLSAAIISIGGGGLIGGIATWLKAHRPEFLVIGSSPRNSCVMVESVRQGRILDLPSLPTLSDGTAGGVEAGALTFDLCRDLIDHYDLPDETDIAAALRLLFEEERLVVEGAAAVAVATLRRHPELVAGRDVAVVLCGGNIGADVWCGAVTPAESAG
jgi:threonine dehydratase